MPLEAVGRHGGEGDDADPFITMLVSRASRSSRCTPWKRPPVRETITYEQAFLDDTSCDPYGFDPEVDLQVSFVGVLDVVQFFDRRGNLSRVHVHGSDVATVTNPTNSRTTTGRP
jgi:hypothetical protein